MTRRPWSGSREWWGPYLRRLKQDVLRDLPEKTEEVRYVQMTGKQRKLYDGQAIHLRSLRTIRVRRNLITVGSRS